MSEIHIPGEVAEAAAKARPYVSTAPNARRWGVRWAWLLTVIFFSGLQDARAFSDLDQITSVDFSCVRNGSLLHLIEIGAQVIDTEDRQRTSGQSEPEHAKRPSGSNILGHKVFSGTLIFFAGLYLFGYALAHSRQFGHRAGLKYLLLSILCVLAGTLTSLSGFFGV